MLRWQLKNVRNRHILWLKLLVCSFITHLFFVGILFFGYRDGVSSHKFTMHSHSLNRQVSIVLAPTTHTSVTNNSNAKQTVIAQNIKSANQHKAATHIAPVKTAQKVPPKKSTSNKATPIKTVAAKIVPVKAVPVKTMPVKTVPVKTAQTKVEPPKNSQKKSAQEQKKQPEIASKPIEKKLEQPKQLAEQKKISEIPSTAATQNSTAPEQVLLVHEQHNGPIQIEIPYNQAREFYQQEALRKELSQHWKPPHGIPDTCSCEITTYVGNNGVVTDSIITQPSGILMYDVSARAAILAMNLPRWTWGTSFAITFKP